MMLEDRARPKRFGSGFGREVLGAPDIDGADIELARLRTRRLDEVRQGLELEVRRRRGQIEGARR